MTQKELNDVFGDYLDKALEMLQGVGLYDLLPENIACNLWKGYRGRTVAKTLYFVDEDFWEMRFCEKYFKHYHELEDETEILDTILHEFCHMLPNALNHGEYWKSYVGKINDQFGMNIKRLG